MSDPIVEKGLQDINKTLSENFDLSSKTDTDSLTALQSIAASGSDLVKNGEELLEKSGEIVDLLEKIQEASEKGKSSEEKKDLNGIRKIVSQINHLLDALNKDHKIAGWGDIKKASPACVPGHGH